jgi:hypothetical protein
MRRGRLILVCLLSVLVAAGAFSESEEEKSSETPKTPQPTGALTLIGRSDGPVVIVERDGTIWEAKKRQLTFYNQATPRIIEFSRQRAEKLAEDAERAAQTAQERAEARAKEEQAKVLAKKAAAERAAEARAAAEKKQEREQKVLANYMDKEYKYGPNSVPEEEE